jgi:hypothetical protein
VLINLIDGELDEETIRAIYEASGGYEPDSESNYSTDNTQGSSSTPKRKKNKKMKMKTPPRWNQDKPPDKNNELFFEDSAFASGKLIF